MRIYTNVYMVCRYGEDLEKTLRVGMMRVLSNLHMIGK